MSAGPGGNAPAGIAKGGKVVFADQLRGLAALLVVLSHMFNVYPFAQGIVSATVAAPQVPDLPMLWVSRAVTQPWINFGPFGVGLFFLVSGFVIPFSLRRHGRGTFLLARALRIYPTYWAALAVACLMIAASAGYWHRPLPFVWRGIWANATLTHTLRGIPSIDQVNWSLVIELHFYLFAALARPWLLRGSLWPMLAAAAGGGALVAAQHAGLVGRPSFLELEAMSLPYMLIGTLFHYHFRGTLGPVALCAAVTALAAVFMGLFEASVVTGGDTMQAASYGYALLVFGSAYAVRAWLPDWRALRLLARISYPLYAVHLPASFVLMTWLMAGPPGWSYARAGTVTFGLMLLLAWALHQGVERWTIRWAAALGQRAPGSHGLRLAAGQHPAEQVAAHGVHGHEQAAPMMEASLQSSGFGSSPGNVRAVTLRTLLEGAADDPHFEAVEHHAAGLDGSPDAANWSRENMPTGDAVPSSKSRKADTAHIAP